MKRLTIAAKPIQHVASITFSTPQKLYAIEKEIRQLIAKRAYEFYELRGGLPGKEMDDWSRAEAEILKPIAVGTIELGENILVSAVIPGFEANELEVGLDSKRLMIHARKGSAGKPTPEAEAMLIPLRIFRAVDLPADVIPGRAHATLRDGIIEFVLPLVEAESKPMVKYAVA